MTKSEFAAIVKLGKLSPAQLNTLKTALGLKADASLETTAAAWIALSERCTYTIG